MTVRKKLLVLLLVVFVGCFGSVDVYAAEVNVASNTPHTTTYIEPPTGIAYRDLTLMNIPAKSLLASIAPNSILACVASEKNVSLNEKDEEVINEEKEEEEETVEEEETQVDVPYFGEDGLLVEEASDEAQEVINLLMYIPGHSNGASYHVSTGLDDMIDNLSVEECVYVIHRIEGAGFGQTAAGYAGYDTHESHQAFLDQQIYGRFDGSIKELLKHWGTYSYGGY